MTYTSNVAVIDTTTLALPAFAPTLVQAVSAFTLNVNPITAATVTTLNKMRFSYNVGFYNPANTEAVTNAQTDYFAN